MSNKEKWKEIPDFNGWYEASTKGRIRTYRTKSRGNKRAKYPKVIRCYINPLGYVYAKLKRDGIRSNYLVHRLVAMTFIDNPKAKPHVNHINFNTGDNCVGNLEWVTPKENIYHTINNGRAVTLKGDDCNYSKLTKEDVIAIREEYSEGNSTHKSIAKKYPVSTRHIGRIINRKRWGHI